MTASPNRHQVFGIRHHGPGSAFALRQALEQMQPDIILVEGPPDADDMLEWLVHADMEPPVALVVYQPEDPGQATYYPMSTFSPEYQALRYGLEHALPVRFMDLPQSIQMAQQAKPAPPDSSVLQALGETAGYRNYESWWNTLIEQRHDTTDLFTGVLHMLTIARADHDAQQANTQPTPGDLLALQREAFMRKRIRAALHENFMRIAVVCGAWHAPALVDLAHFNNDQTLLADLPRVQTSAIWVPWMNSRLSTYSGYGAGITSPGWYHHLWNMRQIGAEPTQQATIWLTHVANLLRDERLDASSAHIIEAVRLSEALAALRGLSTPGLAELNEATQAIFCFGDATPLNLIRHKLIIGDRMGAVPADLPMNPVQRDLYQLQRRLRLRPDLEKSTLALDLRKEMHLERSHLLHRLQLLKIPWGQPITVRRKTGTFREVWRLQWLPEYTVRVIEAAIWGNTVEHAAANLTQDTVNKAQDLPTLTRLLDQAILAELPDTTAHIMRCIENVSAVSSDIPLMMEALLPLARILRYGNVRKTDQHLIQHVVNGLFTRICVGLPTTCTAMDDTAAEAMFKHLTAVNSVVITLQQTDHQQLWQNALLKIVDQPDSHPLLTGKTCRLLLDSKVFHPEDATLRLERVLSLPNLTSRDKDHLLSSAFWLEGFLRDSGMLVLHDQLLWHMLDTWVNHLTSDQFVHVLPLLRRIFSTYTDAARTMLLDRAQHPDPAASSVPTPGITFDQERADAVLPLVARLLGIEE